MGATSGKSPLKDRVPFNALPPTSDTYQFYCLKPDDFTRQRGTL